MADIRKVFEQETKAIRAEKEKVGACRAIHAPAHVCKTYLHTYLLEVLQWQCLAFEGFLDELSFNAFCTMSNLVSVDVLHAQVQELLESTREHLNTELDKERLKYQELLQKQRNEVERKVSAHVWLEPLCTNLPNSICILLHPKRRCINVRIQIHE